jgi:hypothetical protein
MTKTASVCAALLMASGILLAGIGAPDALAGNAGRSAPGSGPAACKGITTGTPGYAACVAAQLQPHQGQQQERTKQSAQVQ